MSLKANERKLFNALRDPEFSNFALLQAEFEGRRAAFIVAINRDGEDYLVGPVALLLDRRLFDRCTCDGKPIGSELQQEPPAA
jgi:hypothetical protein